MGKKKTKKQKERLFEEKLVPAKAGSGKLFDVSFGDDDSPVECMGMTFENDAARREHFLNLLREQLKDPGFRNVEGFPRGEDDDILAMSDPPYYTACPNPFLVELISHLPVREPSSSGGPFATDVSEGKHDPVYKAHTYHTKVPPKAIERFIEHYTKEGDVVLDPFAGSGMTGVAGGLVGGRKIIQCDLAPAATHISAGYAMNWNIDAFRQRAETIMKRARIKHQERFQAVESNKRVGEIKYCVWSDVLLCDSCSEPYTFSDAAVDLENKSIANKYPCPNCGSTQSKSSANYAHETIYDPYLQETITWNRRVPFWIVYEKDGKRIKRKMNDQEVRDATTPPESAEAEAFPVVPYMFRDGKWGCLHRSGYHFGMTHSHHFYHWRSLALLDYIWREIEASPAELRHHLRFWFLATSMKCSKLMTYNADGIGRVMKGNLYISSLGQEVNPLHFLSITLRDMCRALVNLANGSRDVFTSTGSAACLPLPEESVDYVFVDPPFGDNLIYSELNFLWECWLNVFTNEPSETIVNKTFGKDLSSYTDGMTAAFGEMRRVLKSGRWLTVEFHNSKNAVWAALQESLERSGFVIADVRVLDKKHGSIKQVQTAGAVKQDLIITAYKPNGGLESRFQLEAGTPEGVWDFVRTHLRQLPVFVEKDGNVEPLGERKKYLLFDRMVAFHVQRGVTVPVSASEFYQGLVEQFPERDSMYFLAEQVSEYERKRVKVAGVMQLELFVSDEASAIQWLKQALGKKPQTFQELQPAFLKEVSGWHKHEKPLELAELLEQNFLCFLDEKDVPSQIHSYLSSNFKELRGLEKNDTALVAKAKNRWYVPDPRKEADLEKVRARTLLREFDEYREGKGKLKIVRTEALRAGFKVCWQSSDYDSIINIAKRVKESIIQEDPALLMYVDNAEMRMET